MAQLLCIVPTMRWIRRSLLTLLVLLSGPALMASCGSVKLGQDWRTATRDSAGVMPPAIDTPEAVVQVYAARAFNWRGIFAVHTWIATKPRDSKRYTVHQVLGWNAYRGHRVVVSDLDGTSLDDPRNLGLHLELQTRLDLTDRDRLLGDRALLDIDQLERSLFLLVLL